MDYWHILETLVHANILHAESILTLDYMFNFKVMLPYPGSKYH